MDEEDLRKVKELRRRVEQHLDIDEFIFFGSRAYGEPLKHSDFDIIVVSKDFKGLRMAERMNVVFDHWEHDEMLEVFGYTPEEFEMKKKEIGTIREGVKRGVRV